MKKTQLIAPIAIALCVGASSSYAATLATETFTYADGTLTGQSGGSGFSTAWGNANGNTASGVINVVSNQAVSDGTTNSVQTIFRGLNDSFGSTGEVWVSFDYQRTNGAFNGISFFTGNSEKALIGGAGSFTSFWTLGRDGNGATAVSSGIASNVIKTGVARFNLAAGTGGSMELWVGSGVGPVDVTGVADATIAGLTLTGVDTIRIGSGLTTNGAQTIDDFRYGQTFSDVNAIPEPNAYALLGGLAALGFVTTRRRRK